MKKIMYGSRKSKRKWYDTNTELRSVASVDSTVKPTPSKHTIRRMMIRDKLFMEHITDMMSMGQVSDILKDGLEITHVKITPDFKHVNVYYIPNNDSLVLDQEALHKCAGIIRHELSQLRVIGVVPPIQFVQNKQHFTEKEVEKRLAMINFEEESETLGEQEQLDISIANADSKTGEFYIQLPVMRHDVFGLDHHRITSQIVSAMSKSKKASQRRMLDADTSTDENTCDPISKEVEFVTRKEQQKVFSDFLDKRRKEEKLKRRAKQLDRQKLLNTFEEIDNEEFDYENDEDINDECLDEDIDKESNNEFKDETRK